MRIFISIIMIVLLSGCVGVLYGRGKVRETNNPNIREQKGNLGFYESKEVAVAADLVSAWGEPDSVKLVGDREEWKYELDSTISNDIIFILGVIPIPIDIPDEAETVIFTVKDGKVEKAQTKFEEPGGGVCGFYFVEHFGIEFGCTR